MAVVSNVEVYCLDRSIWESEYPMAVNVEECTEELIDRQIKQAKSVEGLSNDNFLRVIFVRFDLTFTIKGHTDEERKHSIKAISNQLVMCGFSEIEFTVRYDDYIKKKSEYTILSYKLDKTKSDNLRLLYNSLAEIKLEACIHTNYQQLKTIYSQRKDHRLPEWRDFCSWIKTLPHSELITD